MKPKTEELLYLLLWSADQLSAPTFRNLNESFESWAYRNGLSRQLAVLEQRKLVERKSAPKTDRLYRLTKEGRLHALGGRDPHARWSRKWDGLWRMVLYDLPTAQKKERTRLRRYLLERGFGYLQDSVWISPDPLEEEIALLRGGKVNVEALLLLEAKTCAGESDAQIVAGAWDFAKINRHYSRHLAVLAQKPAAAREPKTQRQALRRWGAIERAAWARAVNSDPLLPEKLLPPKYLGRRAWQERIKILGDARRHIEDLS